jgi:hypothetical protein
VDRIIARFTPEFLAECAELGSEDPTPILILGMPRSGTTLVERVVSSHPHVRGRGELDFWRERGPAWAYAKTAALRDAARPIRDEYLRTLRDGASDSLRVTDKMPFNFFWIGLVHMLLPNARFIHCRRDPIDTCLSIYTTAFTTDWGFSSDFADLASYYRQYVRLMDHWQATNFARSPCSRGLRGDGRRARGDCT